MSGKLSGLRKRLAKVERQLADHARREGLANCTCSAVTLAIPGREREFEAEMNLPCPAHGLRRLGKIICLRPVGPEKEPWKGEEFTPRQDPMSPETWIPKDHGEIDRLLDLYDARLAEQDSQKLEQEDGDDAEEF